MYVPHHYKNENLEEVRSFIEQNSFGLLVNQVNGKPWATHIPLELEKDGDHYYLVGHLAKANPQCKSFTKEAQVLCIFNGPHAYISSSWYKEEEVPTWNYIAVHVYGRLTLLDEQATLVSLDRLINKYEKDSEHPVLMRELSANTMKQIKGIVGFSIHIDEIQAAYKLSQNRSKDHAAIIKNLKSRGVTESEIARHIEKITPSNQN